MNTIITPYETNGVATPHFSQYPTEFGHSWVQVTKFENHPTLTYAVCLYINDKYPNGTIVFSKYISNDYPDMYYTLDYNHRANRVYTNPVYRRRGYWKIFGTLMRSIIYNYNGVIPDGSADRANAVEKAYLAMVRIGKQKGWLPNNGRMFNHQGSEIEPPREPAFPLIWYNQRIGGITNAN